MNQPVTRRSFLTTGSLAAAAAVAFPRVLRAQPAVKSPNNRLNVAIIGVGGVGANALVGTRDENIVAFCDVDEVRAGPGYARLQEKFPEAWARCKDAPRFNDYRRMFDALGKQIDAVTISIPDHMHFPAAMTAIALGKHVYCQKPLTHTVGEARKLMQFAREKKVVTQMGNQGHAGEGCRVLKEWVQAGVLGEVREVKSWTDRPREWFSPDGPPDHSKFIPVVPKTLNWEAWLGIAAEREYDPSYLPFGWRMWWDFGTGAFGDVACHIMDGAYWALDLGTPTSLEAMTRGGSAYGAPRASVVTMNFPARGAMPPVKYTWSDGRLMPTRPDELEANRQLPEEAGTLIFGSKATVLCDFYYGSVRIIPEAKMQEMAPHLPPKTIPRVGGDPFAEWLRACKGGPKAGSNFDYSAPLTETVLLANVALRTHRRIEWDAAAMQVTNFPEANQLLTKQYRPGWF